MAQFPDASFGIDHETRCLDGPWGLGFRFGRLSGVSWRGLESVLRLHIQVEWFSAGAFSGCAVSWHNLHRVTKQLISKLIFICAHRQVEHLEP